MKDDSRSRANTRTRRMCGKFTQMMSWGELVTLADLVGEPASPVETVTPMRFANVIRCDTEGRREVARMRWGFVPATARDRATGRSSFTPARRPSSETDLPRGIFQAARDCRGEHVQRRQGDHAAQDGTVCRHSQKTSGDCNCPNLGTMVCQGVARNLRHVTVRRMRLTARSRIGCPR